MNEQRIEVDRLAMEAQNGSQQAKQALYEQCAGLLLWEAKRIGRRFTSLNIDDVKQELYIVFDRCITYFNPEIGSFSTLFINAARQKAPEIYAELQLIRIKRTFLTYKVNQSKGRNVPETAKRIYECGKIKLSELYPRMEDERQKNPLNLAEEDERKNIVRNALKFLPERQKAIIEYYYGIDQTPANLERIGAIFGITRERVRQIILEGRKKLKDVLEHFYTEGSI